MMPVAKHFDPVMGVDIHIVTIPPAGPVPIPHPHISLVMDLFDYVPILGGTVKVGGIVRATAGTSGQAIPHIPMGGPFIKPPGNEDEMFMGSATVLADQEPLSFTALPVLSCQDVGMLPPVRTEKPKKTFGMVLPTSVVISIPAGLPVMVGGPPTVSMAAVGGRLGFAMLGRAFRRLRELQRASRRMRRISAAIHRRAARAMRALGVPPSVRNRVHRGICAVTGHPVDVASGKLFTDTVDFELPGPIPLKWERCWLSTSVYDGPLGHGWHHGYDMALMEDNGAVAVRLADARPLAFPVLKEGESSFDRNERVTLIRNARGYGLDTLDGLRYCFEPLKSGDACHKLTVILQKSTGIAMTFRYDDRGRLKQIVDSAGRLLRLEYQGALLHKIWLPQADALDGEDWYCAVQYHYHDGMLTAAADALGATTGYAYADRLLIKETYPSGLSFYFRFDGRDHNARCIETWGDGGIYYRAIRYDLANNITWVRDGLGHTLAYHHDGALPNKIIDPLGQTSTIKYNEFHQILCETDELGQKTQYTYDEYGYTTQVIYPDGNQAAFTYDQNHNLIEEVDLLGNPRRYRYDNLGRLQAETDPLGHTTSYSYNDRVLVAVEDAAGNRYHFEYDQYLNITAVHDGAELAMHWQYDALGNVESMTDAKGNRRNFRHDLLGRVIQVQEPDGNVRELAYDADSNLIHARDRLYDVQFTYSGMGRLLSRSQAGTTVKFEYDLEEQLTAIVNEHGRVYQFDLDPCGEIIQESGFDGLIRRYQRNPLGQAVRVDQPDGRYSEYRYDPMGRVTRVEHSNGEREQYQYRADGVLIKASNGSITLSMEYDALGQLTKETQGEYWVTSEYDALGNRVRVRSSFGLDQVITRNSRGDVTQVSLGQADSSTDFMRDPLGLELQRTMPGGLRSRWQRDRLGRPVQHQVSWGQKTHHQRTYVWGMDDRLLKVIDQLNRETLFQHDALGNLVAAKYGDSTLDLRMPDAVGNLFRSQGRTDREYGPAGQLLAVHGKQGATRYHYDAEGNLISKITADNRVWRYEWTSAGFMNKVIRPDGREVTFTYDPLGRRISKTFNGKKTRWVWDGNNPLHEWVERDRLSLLRAQAAANDPCQDEIAADQRPLTLQPIQAQAPPLAEGSIETPITWLFEPDSFAPMGKQIGDDYYPIITDYLGTPVAMFDSAGEKVWSADISVWGDLRNVQGHRQDCSFRWPGQYEDEETGLYYNRFRYYDPEAGQYVSQDPIGLVGGNPTLYGYVSDPLSWIDVFGLACHGNSRASRRPTHVYVIRDRRTGEVHKWGISSGRIRRDGRSSRAELQVRRLGSNYESQIVARNLTRSKALSVEQGRVNAYSVARQRAGTSHGPIGPLGNVRPTPKM